MENDYANLLELDDIKISFVLEHCDEKGIIFYGVVFEDKQGNKLECINSNGSDIPVNNVDDLEMFINHSNKFIFKGIRKLIKEKESNNGK
jgi:hypothetical protein